MYSKWCIVHTVLTHRYATSQAPPSVDDDHRPIVYNPPSPALYQVAPLQPYGSVPNPYPTSHPSHPLSPPSHPPSHPPSPPPSHALAPPQAFPPQAFPPQRPSTDPYTVQAAYTSPVQPQPPVPVPTHWAPPPGSIANSNSGNTENSTVGGSYNNTSTRTDHRVNAQVIAHTSNVPTVFVQNLLNVSSL